MTLSSAGSPRVPRVVDFSWLLWKALRELDLLGRELDLLGTELVLPWEVTLETMKRYLPLLEGITPRIG